MIECLGEIRGFSYAWKWGEQMPRMPRRGCAYGTCGRLAVEGSQYCEEHKKLIDKQYNQYERSPDVKKKYGRAWKKIRDRYFREHPLCERCLA